MLVLIFTSKLPRELGRFKKKLYHMSVPMNMKHRLVLGLKLGWRCPMRTWGKATLHLLLSGPSPGRDFLS